MPEKIEFAVDEKYENEKGIFTVLSIHRGQMLIRWENGEKIKTDIDLQRRIAERRQWEKNKRLAETETALKPASKSPSTVKKSVFPGLAPTDFKKTASGTTWRSRSQLGAAIAQKIGTTRFTFNSWAFGNKPEMHVQDTHHRSDGGTDDQARFFVRVDSEALHYGFKVARPHDNKGASTDWNAFSQWISLPENEQMLRTIALKNDLTVCNRTGPAADTLTAVHDGWCASESSRQSCKETLSAYIHDTPESGVSDMEFAVTMDRSDAVACGRDIAKNIASLFTQLVPLYRAAVIR